MVFNIASLRRASFNGIPFWVETGDVEAGHRVATTHVPNGTHVNESFGPSARKFEISAYVTGDEIAFADALLAAAERQHLGQISLPDQLSQRVRLTKAVRGFDKSKLGFITVKIEAVAEPAATSALTPAILAQQIFGQALAVPAAFGAYVAAALQPALAIAGMAEAIIGLVARAPADLAALGQIARLAPEPSARFDVALGAATAALAALPANPAGFGEALAEAAIVLADEATPATLAGALRELGRPAAQPPAPDASLSGAALALAADVALALTAAGRALALAESVARTEWATRPEAESTRALAAAVFADALARVGREGYALRRELAGLNALTLERATLAAASLAPLVTVRTRIPLPSLVLAHKLYVDPSRAAELFAAPAAHTPATCRLNSRLWLLNPMRLTATQP